ncbi:Zinc ribbon domain-containing protein [Desulfarculales bacterium]
MPIYEFRCEKCQQIFEHLALGNDQADSICCPACASEDLSRVLSSCACVEGGSRVESAISSNPCVQNRSCQNAGSCSTINLPGYSR